MGFGGKSFGGFGDKVAPVKVGEEIEVAIDAVGAKGDGIAKKEGFVIFVPGARQGETVKIKISKVLANMAFADVVGKANKRQEKDEAREFAESQTQAAAEPVDTENFGEE